MVETIIGIIILLAGIAIAIYIVFLSIVAIICGGSPPSIEDVFRSLIFILPVDIFFVLLIILVVYIIKQIFKAIFEKKEIQLENNKIILNNNQRAVMDYIDQARNRGMADAEITNALLSAGWKEDFIADVYKIITAK